MTLQLLEVPHEARFEVIHTKVRQILYSSKLELYKYQHSEWIVRSQEYCNPCEAKLFCHNLFSCYFFNLVKLQGKILTHASVQQYLRNQEYAFNTRDIQCSGSGSGSGSGWMGVRSVVTLQWLAGP